MAGFGVGIGAFMDGFSGGMRMRQGMEDRARSQAREDRFEQDRLFDRQRRINQEDEARAREIEERKRRLEREEEDRSFTREQRERQRKAWADEDATKEVFRSGMADAEAKRAADVKSGVAEIEAQGPTQDGRGLPAFKVGDKTFLDPKEAEAASDAATKPVMDYYMTKAAPKVVQGLIEQGKVKEAQAFQNWIKDEKVQAGMKSWAASLPAASRGDAEAFAKHTLDAYNNNDYMADGARADGKLLRDKEGNIDGIELTIVDAQGKESKQVFRGMEDLYRMGTQFLAPEEVFKNGLAQMEAAQRQRAEIAKEKRMQGYRIEEDTNKALLDAAREAAKRQGPQAYDAFVKRIDAAMGDLLANDPSFASLPDEEKAARAVKYLEAQNRAASGALTGAGAAAQGLPPAAKGIPVWRPQQK